MPSSSDVKTLSAFLEEYDAAEGCVLCRASQLYEEDGIVFYPFIEGIKAIFKMAE